MLYLMIMPCSNNGGALNKYLVLLRSEADAILASCLQPDIVQVRHCLNVHVFIQLSVVTYICELL